jgi:hypothetical protein
MPLGPPRVTLAMPRRQHTCILSQIPQVKHNVRRSGGSLARSTHVLVGVEH